MNLIRLLCFNLVMLPFYIIGFFMHLCMLGYELIGPLMATLLLPVEVRKALADGHKPIVVSRQEAEAFINDYLEKNPEASTDDALKAFIKTKQGGDSV